jgi:hypothetical protein
MCPILSLHLHHSQPITNGSNIGEGQLNRMAVVGPVRMGSILGLPELALLRGDPRLKALRKKVRLPE